jgi:Uma2 family endonuclease
MVAAPTPSSPPLPPDPRFPGLRADVVAGYLAAPDTTVAEVIDGELSLMPRPRRQHARAAGRLGAKLDGPYDLGEGGPGGWVFLHEPELHLGQKPDILAPDLAGWRRERVPKDFLADDATAYTDLAPDWVCEVLSECTEATDRGKKRRIYRRERVGHYWLVDPRDRTLEVYRLVDGKWWEVDTYEGDAIVRAEPFDAIELDLSLLWKL